jgi:hypothetical protein
MKLINPKSSESRLPLLVADRKFKVGFFLQAKAPFGLYIRVPFLFARWGSA